MLQYNFKYELKQLLRSRWIQTLCVVLLLLFAFSSKNGKQKVEKRLQVITAVEQEVAQTDALMLKLIDSVAQGHQVSVPSWTIPTNPMAVGNYHPRVAAMKPQPFSFMATGQSDVFTPYLKPTVSGDDFALNFSEMTSPIQLLFGSFDLAFVIVYLLPLLIIAFSYNVLSAEKESGSILLLASQPISINIWLLQKLGVRFFGLSLLVVLTMTVALSIFGIAILSNFALYVFLLMHTLAYMLFWFVLAFLANLFVGNSAKNAVVLVGLWISFVLLVPSILNQLGTTLYPMPSRILMINEMRDKKLKVTEKQDEILDNYLRDHPEYAISNDKASSGFYHRYIASQKLVKEEMAPIVSAFEAQLKNQRQLLGRFKWVSPALMLQASLNKLAGNSSDDYEHFRKQVITFSETWRNHLTPFLFNNQDFTVKDYANLPKFEMEQNGRTSQGTVIPLVLISLSLLAIGFLFLRKAGIDLI